jgi:hypothetical protein
MFNAFSAQSPSLQSSPAIPKPSKRKRLLPPLLTYTPLKRRQTSPIHPPTKHSQSFVTYTPFKELQSPEAFQASSQSSANQNHSKSASPCQITAANDLRLPPLLIGPDHNEEAPSIAQFQWNVKEKQAALHRISRLEKELDEAKTEIGRLRTFITEEGHHLLDAC